MNRLINYLHDNNDYLFNISLQLTVDDDDYDDIPYACHLLFINTRNFKRE